MLMVVKPKGLGAMNRSGMVYKRHSALGLALISRHLKHIPGIWKNFLSDRY